MCPHRCPEATNPFVLESRSQLKQIVDLCLVALNMVTLVSPAAASLPEARSDLDLLESTAFVVSSHFFLTQPDRAATS